jgi:DeoR/GlpR family transcriptional regulator of sugar metabolism
MKRKRIGGDAMLAIERRQLIMNILVREKKVYVSDLAKKFAVTEETIRRDLEKLEKENLLRRSYGGAILSEQTSEDLPFVNRTIRNNQEKAIIAKNALPLINDGDTIMTDSSTTCLTLMQYLQQKHNLTIITNSVHILSDFIKSPFQLIFSGGILRPKSFALVGSTACASLKKYYVDLAIISCKSIDIKKGIMESNEEESVVKRTMIQQAKESVLLADHTKFDKTAFIKTCDIPDISCIITDRAPSKDWIDYLGEKKIKLIY